jgi:hypothetical protein
MNSNVTLAMELGPTSWVPEKITSFMDEARKDLADCSPSAHLAASMMLLLPHPLGPAMQVTPLEMASDIFFAMDLKPLISTLDNFTPHGLAELDSRCKHPYGPHSLNRLKAGGKPLHSPNETCKKENDYTHRR